MPEPTYFQVSFLPWITVPAEYTVAGVRFVPFYDPERKVSAGLEDLEQDLRLILSGYHDQKGRPIRNCTVALVGSSERSWNIRDEDFGKIKRATNLLMLSAFASNEYFCALGAYVNSTAFQMYGQRFDSPASWVAIRKRRRDGQTIDAGYRHGEIKTSVPTQCANLHDIKMDEALITAVNSADKANCPLIRRLHTSLSFFSLANTDDGNVTMEAELLMMACALEELLDSRNTAEDLSGKLDLLFRPFGNVTAQEACKNRGFIKIRKSLANSTQSVFVYRAWIEELYKLRGMIAHGNDLGRVEFGWHVFEHLVMAVYLVPLLVKILLEHDGFYSLTDCDKHHCLAVDRLLSATEWKNLAPGATNSEQTQWREIISQAAWDQMMAECLNIFRQGSPST